MLKVFTRLQHSRRTSLFSVFVVSLSIAGSFLLWARPATAGATASGCTPASGDATASYDNADTPASGITITTAGTYTLWLRMLSPDGTHNTLRVSVDGGSCVTMGATMAANTWTWVDTTSGTSTPVTFNLSAGAHTMVVTGNSGVGLDEIQFLADPNCVPSGTTNNCTLNQPTPPTVSVSSPTSGSTVSGSVTLTAAASDTVGLAQVQFQVDGVNVGSPITSSPYSTTWNTTTATNATHTITAIATNTAGLTTTSSPITVTVANNTCSGTPTAPSNFSDTDSSPLPANKVDLSWTAGKAASNCTLAGYNIYRGTGSGSLTKITSTPVTGTTYTDSTVAAGTSYTYQVTAVDTSGSAPESVKAPSTPLAVTTGQNCRSGSSSLPTTPTLSATSNSSYTSIPLSWTASTVNNGCTLSGYHVYRVGTSSPIYTGTLTSFSDTGVGLTPANLSSGTAYSYYVVAYDSGGNLSSSSATATATTKADNVAPTTPTGLSGTALNASTISLSWTASSDLPNPGAVGVTGYYIFKNDNLVTPYATLTTSASGTITWTDSVSPSTTNKYAIAAFDKNLNESSITADTAVTTPAAAANCTSSSAAPSSPTSLSSPSQTMTTITLSWNASIAASGCSITGYQVMDTTTGNLTTVTGTTYTDSGLTPNKSYAYMVVAVESNGLQSAAATLTKSTAADTQAPTAPTNFTATPTSAGQVSLSWTASTDTVGVTSYVLTREEKGTTPQQIDLGPVTNYVDNSVTAATSYTYTLVAYDAAGNASAVATASVTTEAASCSGAPSMPTGLSVTAESATSVALTWNAATAPSGCSIIGYKLFGGTNGTTLLTPNLVSATSYTNTGLSAHTSYSYTVEAVDSAGLPSPASAVLTATTLTSNGCSVSYIADVNNDCAVNFNDLTAFVQDYKNFNGKLVSAGSNGDVNDDGAVNAADLFVFAQYYPLENGQ